MSTEHRYKLEKGSKKQHCPECAKKRFVKYIDTKTGEYLSDQYGRCDRESKCSYHLNPYKDGYSKMIWEQEQGNETDWKPQQQKRAKNLTKPVIEFIPFDVFSRSRAGYEQNVFIQNLLTRIEFPFDVHDIEKIIAQYNLGTVQNGYRKGAITFPFIDVKNNVRAIQVKQFDETNHTTGTDFLHSIIEKYQTKNNKQLPEWLEAYNKNETKVSCLFGEHLLTKYPHNPIALVEAPKTAIYGTLYFGFPGQPANLLWLAVYNLSSLNLNKCQALTGRNVYLFPDLSKDGRAFELWSNKARKIQKQLQGTFFQVSNLLEQLASEQDKEKGKDIADYLIKQDWRLFRKLEAKETLKPEPFAPLKSEKSENREAVEKTFFSQPKIEILENTKVQNSTQLNIENLTKPNIDPLNYWSNEISELETYFANTAPPTNPIKLNNWTTVTDVPLFIQSQFAAIKGNNEMRIFIPHLNRLQELKQVLNTN